MNLSIINPVFIELFGLEIRWYAILIVSGALLATYLSNKEAIRKKFPKDFIVDLLFYLLPIGIIGARIYYVLFKFEDYSTNLWKIVAIWEGGIAIYGGLLAGVGVIYWYAKKFKTSALVVLDMITPTVLLAQAIGRWGNFINQEAYGEAVSRQFLESIHLPNIIIEQMYVNGVYYQPTFLYESILSFIGFIVLMFIRKHVTSLKIGDMTLFYIIWYGIERFFVEGMRTDSLWLGSLRVSQVLSLVLVIVSVIIFVYRRYKPIELYAQYEYQHNGEKI